MLQLILYIVSLCERGTWVMVWLLPLHLYYRPRSQKGSFTEVGQPGAGLREAYLRLKRALDLPESVSRSPLAREAGLVGRDRYDGQQNSSAASRNRIVSSLSVPSVTRASAKVLHLQTTLSEGYSITSRSLANLGEGGVVNCCLP